jgi:MarR family transcriptional regulator, lower aerobic nicotinate degradation pathway regulator
MSGARLRCGHSVRDREEVVVSGLGVVDHLSAPGHLLRRAQQVHTEAWSRILSGRVTGPQYAILVAVAGWPGGDQKRAGDLASLDKSTAATVIGRLVAGGWLERLRDPDDGRRRVLQLTDHGQRNLPDVTIAARQVQAELLRPLPEQERDEFLDSLGCVARLEESDIRDQRVEDRTLVMARTPGYLIRRAQQLHAAYWNEQVRDVTGPQYAVLAAVLAAGVATYAEIGARVSLDSSSTREIIGRLTDKGWLEPAGSRQDRRSRPVRVTLPAATAVRLLRESVVRVQEHVLEPLVPADRDHFIRQLQRVARVSGLEHTEGVSSRGQNDVGSGLVKP